MKLIMLLLLTACSSSPWNDSKQRYVVTSATDKYFCQSYTHTAYGAAGIDCVSLTTGKKEATVPNPVKVVEQY